MPEVEQQVRAPLRMAELMGAPNGVSSECCSRTSVNGVAGASLETVVTTRAPLERESVETSVESAPLETVMVGTGASLEGTGVLAVWIRALSKGDTVEGEESPFELTCLHAVEKNPFE